MVLKILLPKLDSGDISSFVIFIAQSLIETQELMLKELSIFGNKDLN